MYHLKMGKPMSNARSMRTPMLPELSDDNKRTLLLPQVLANNQANKRSCRSSQQQHQETSTHGTSCSSAATPR
jgi:hypothetical protein